MKTILRIYVYSLFALWLATLIFESSFKILGGVNGFLYSAAIFGILSLLIKPILKLIFFPINFLTFGIFSWAINAVLLYLLVRISPAVKISAWNFPGLYFANISLSSYHLNLWETFIVISLFIGIIVNLLVWLSK